MGKLAAVIGAYNRADFVGTCIASVLRAAGPGLDVHVIVMDNGSTDDTPAVLRALGAVVEVLRTEDNRHVVETYNRGLRHALADESVDYVLMMNEDTEFTEGSLERLVAACEAHPATLLTPLQRNYRMPECVDDNAYDHLLDVRPLIEDAILGRPLQQIYPLPTIIGAAMFAHRAVWEHLGEFDENFWFYGIDDDLCTRARHHGYATCLVPESHLFHAHGKLDAAPQSVTKAAVLRKWRFETQARYLFLLKDPTRPFSRNVLAAALALLDIEVQCLRAPWPTGMWHGLTIFLDCMKNLRRIRDTRARHFEFPS
jgi:GT2 family glycosyltransferase